jgi:hypothetical protein
VKAISLKLPTDLLAKLNRAAKLRCKSKSEIVRAALEQFLNGDHSSQPPASALDLAGDLLGCANGPADLSTNRRQMHGYGKQSRTS